jgi:hypothetical protein
VSNVFEYEAGAAVVVVLVSGVLVVGVGAVVVETVESEGTEDVVVLEGRGAVEVVLGAVVVDSGASASGSGTLVTNAAAEGDPTRVGVSVTDDRTDPTAAAAMKTANKVAMTQAMARPMPRRIPTSLDGSHPCAITGG